jgi:hypothetical protein
MNHSVLDLYTDYLISSFSQTSATGLSRLVDQAVSHDQVSRFLSSDPFESKDLWRLVKGHIRQIESDDGVVIIDDTIVEKPYTDENEIICWHYDHSKERNVKGINFLSALYHTEVATFPLCYDIVDKTATYLDKKTGKARRKSALTKNERYRNMLLTCQKNGIRYRYVLNDVWYASAENMMFIKHELKKDFIMPLKANRKVALSLSDKQRGIYVKLAEIDLEDGALRQIYLEGVDLPLLVSKQVFTNEDGSSGVLYLITSDLTLTHADITTIYQKRWNVEVYHKSLKQNASLAKSPTRTKLTQSNHLFAALCAYIKLESLKIRTKRNHFALKTQIYVCALRSAFDQLHYMNPYSFENNATA